MYQGEDKGRNGGTEGNSDDGEGGDFDEGDWDNAQRMDEGCLNAQVHDWKQHCAECGTQYAYGAFSKGGGRAKYAGADGDVPSAMKEVRGGDCFKSEKLDGQTNALKQTSVWEAVMTPDATISSWVIRIRQRRPRSAESKHRNFDLHETKQLNKHIAKAWKGAHL